MELGAERKVQSASLLEDKSASNSSGSEAGRPTLLDSPENAFGWMTGQIQSVRLFSFSLYAFIFYISLFSSSKSPFQEEDSL